MKIILQKEHLEQALTTINRIVHSQTLQALQGVRITTKPKLIVFQGTNIEISIEVRTPGESSDNVDVVVPIKTLLEIVKLLPKTEVQLSFTDTTCVVVSQKGKTSITLLPKNDFPPLPVVESDIVFEIESQKFISGIQSVLYAVSNSTIKPELASVSLYSYDNALYFVGTDSFRLSEKKIPFQSESDFPSILIPYKNAQELCSFILNMKDENIHISIDEDLFECRTTNAIFSSKLTSGNFPDYKKIIPTKFSTECIVLKNDFALALKKASIMSDATKQVKIDIAPQDSKCVITSKNNTMGETVEELTATTQGDAIQLHFNERYIQDSLQSITVDSIKLGFSGPGKPLILQGISDGSFLYLVMPMNK